MAENKFTLQLKRNSNAYTSKATALAGLKSALSASTAKVAEPMVAIYTENDVEKVLLGIVSSTGKYTIFEGANVKEDGSIEVPDVVQKAISDAIAGLKGDAGTDYDTLGKLEDKIQEEAQTARAAEKANADAIAAMDLDKVGGGTSEVITSVSQEDGKVTAEKGTLSSTDKTIKVNGLDLAVNIDGTTITKSEQGVLSVAPTATAVSGENAIEVTNDNGKKVSLKIVTDEKVLSQDTNGLKSTITIVKETTGLESNVKEQYKLVGKDGSTALGETIKIYKDSSLKSVELGSGEDDQKLIFTYIKADGTEEVVKVDISSFLAESEFGNGLQVVDHKVSVKKATDSETYLVVDENGVAVKGVKNAIDAAVLVETNRAKAAEEANAEAISDLKEALGVEDDEPIVPVETQIQNAIEDLDSNAISNDGKAVTVKVTMEDGKVTAVNVTEKVDTQYFKLDATSGLTLADNVILDCGTY